MKKRSGFVSNSSSSSFIVNLKDLPKLAETQFDEEHAIAYAKESLEDEKRWWDKYPEHRKTETFDSTEIYDKYFNECKNNHDILLSDIKDKNYTYKTSHSLAEEYRFAEEHIYVRDGETPKWDDLFNKYEISDLGNIKQLMPLSIYYLIKDELDTYKGRKKIYEEIRYVDLTYGDITCYTGNKRISAHKQRKNDLSRIREYKKKYMNMSSYTFYQEVILNSIIDNWIGSGWCSWLELSNKRLSKKLVRVMEAYERNLIPICNKLVDDFINKRIDEEFADFEYSDGGGCGTTARMLHDGMYFDKVPYQHISHH